MHNKDEQQVYSGTERQRVGNRDQGAGATTGEGGGCGVRGGTMGKRWGYRS